jgi:hypothetical protein
VGLLGSNLSRQLREHLTHEGVWQGPVVSAYFGAAVPAAGRVGEFKIQNSKLRIEN